MVSFYNMFLVNLLKFSEHGCFIPTKKKQQKSQNVGLSYTVYLKLFFRCSFFIAFALLIRTCCELVFWLP